MFGRAHGFFVQLQRMSTTACANGSVSDIDWDVNDVPEGGVSDVSLTPEDVAHVNGGLVIDNHTGGASGLDDGDVAMGEANRGPTGASDAEEGTADDAEDAAMEDAEVSSDEDDVLPPRRRAGARSMPRNSASSSDDSAPIPGNCGPCPADVVFDKCARRLDREDGDVLYVDDSSEGGSDEDSRQRWVNTLVLYIGLDGELYSQFGSCTVSLSRDVTVRNLNLHVRSLLASSVSLNDE